MKANNKTCSICCNGNGEVFIRVVVAFNVGCLIEWKSLSLHGAIQVGVNKKLPAIKGEGGMIGVYAPDWEFVKKSY